MNIITNNTNTNFKAHVKYTPYMKSLYGKMSSDHMERFLEAQRKLGSINNKSELLLTRKKNYDKKIIPVIINLNTGSMVANFNSEIKKMTKSSIELLEKISNPKDPLFKRLFSKSSSEIQDSISNVLIKTEEISIHPPVPQQKLHHIELSNDEVLKMKKYDNKFSNKTNIFLIPNNLKIHIKNYDEGYNFIITDLKNIPTGQYFMVNYTATGYNIAYNNATLKKDAVLKMFNRYTNKSLELR